MFEQQLRSAGQHHQASVGTFSINMANPAAVLRIPAKSSTAACTDTAGSDAVAIETPNRPMGKYIGRNAWVNHDTAQS